MNEVTPLLLNLNLRKQEQWHGWVGGCLLVALVRSHWTTWQFPEFTRYSDMATAMAAHRMVNAAVLGARSLRTMGQGVDQRDQGVAVVQGAARGLGLEYVSQLLERPELRVVATCRDPDGATSLHALQEKYRERLDLVGLDVTQEDTIKAAAKHVREKYGKVDTLINVAGILHLPGVSGLPETSLTRLQEKYMMLNYQVNAMGPTLVAKEFMPALLEASKRAVSEDGRIPIVANMSARVSSISDNKIGGWYSYRASKTALNMFNKCMAIEYGRKKTPVTFICLHPGTCDTDLSKPFQKNMDQSKLFTKERGVKQLLGIIDAATQEDTGTFFAWDGQEIPF